MAFVFFALRKAYAITVSGGSDGKLLIKSSVLSAAIISVMLIFGNSFYKYNNMDLIFYDLDTFVNSIVVLIGLFLLFYPAFIIGYTFIKNLNIEPPEKNEWLLFGKSLRSFFFLWIVIFLCWLPVYLAYYPGVFSYDIDKQAYQALGLWNYSNFHPVLHTFLFQVCINLGRGVFGTVTAGHVTYSITQMLLMSLVFAAAMHYLAKFRVHFIIRIIALIYFAINPFNSIFSFVPTKDVLFAGIFLLFTLMVIDAYRDSKSFFSSPWRVGAIAVLAVLMCLFRNNAIYAFILFVPFFVYAFRKHLKQALAATLPVVIVFFLITGPLFSAMGIGGGNAREALSVPMQQISLVVVNHEDELSDKDKENIAKYLEYDKIKDHYNPRFADYIKYGFNTEHFLKDKAGFINIWGSLLLRYPDEYINAFLQLNLGYWYPDAEFPDQYSHRAYIETNIYDFEEYQLTRESKLPGLLKTMEDFAWKDEQQKIPVVSMLFSTGFVVWFLVIGIIICFLKRQRRLSVIFLPSFFLWLTFMAGPVSNVRYIYPIIALYPLLAAVLLQNVSGKDKKVESE